MVRKIIFDMDGTIADLYGVADWLPKLRAEDESPYLNAEPMVNMGALVNILQELRDLGWLIVVTSWLAMNSSKEYKDKVRQAKREWILKYDLPIDEIHLVQYGTPKQKCTKGDVQILIDDSADVRKSFEKQDAGRFVVNPQTTDILQFLESLI